jgi:hypothetical protein
MKRHHYIALLVLLLCCAALFMFWGREHPVPIKAKQDLDATVRKEEGQSPSPPPMAILPPLNPQLANQETQEQKLTRLFSNAINFYGKVVDENGLPVEAARVRYSAPSSFIEIQKGSIDGPITGPDGKFAITGKQGAGIQVSVSHLGYYETDKSHGQFTYFENTDKNPTTSNPAVFVLQKKGTSEPLLKLKQVLRTVPKDGRAVQVGLSEEKAGDITVQAWTSPRAQGAANNAPFDWKVRVEVPGGGLVANEDQFQFQAPESGYAPAIEYDMPVSGIEGKWRDRLEQTYFVKLGNGNYARMRFQMIAGGNHFAVVESYYNPSGSRNLEYDPNMTVKK